MDDHSYLISHALQQGLVLTAVLMLIQQVGEPLPIPVGLIVLFAVAYALQIAGSLFWAWWPFRSTTQTSRHDRAR